MAEHTFYPRLELLIDGQWSRSSDSRTREVIDPCTEQVIGLLPVATTDDVQRALDAAQRSFPAWRRTSPAARAAIIVKAVGLVRERAGASARTITLELGKPLAESFIEDDRPAVVFEWHAAEAQRAYGRIVPAAPGVHHSVVREPVGVVAAFTPWNGP
ncbi:MAG: aldehyde dehydrogenase family protein, partial [Microbacteriaceae bacterium]|nr:aldehyde dehydrogenase family protein [Burkholderiaceae bacterium]